MKFAVRCGDMCIWVEGKLQAWKVVLIWPCQTEVPAQGISLGEELWRGHGLAGQQKWVVLLAEHLSGVKMAFKLSAKLP